jgi:hypothetical protein
MSLGLRAQVFVTQDGIGGWAPWQATATGNLLTGTVAGQDEGYQALTLPASPVGGWRLLGLALAGQVIGPVGQPLPNLGVAYEAWSGAVLVDSGTTWFQSTGTLTAQPVLGLSQWFADITSASPVPAGTITFKVNVLEPAGWSFLPALNGLGGGGTLGGPGLAGGLTPFPGGEGLGMASLWGACVPEPQTYAMVAGLGLVGFALWRRRAA